jgi:hypothetical protein
MRSLNVLLDLTVDATWRLPSHVVNELSAPVVFACARIAGASTSDALNMVGAWRVYMERLIDAQCDAFVGAPLGKKWASMFLAAYDDRQADALAVFMETFNAAMSRAGRRPWTRKGQDE